MKWVALFFVMFCVLQGNAQNIFFRSTSKVEYSEQINFNQTIYWRKHFNKESGLKTIYNLNSIYKTDSLFGILVYGIDIDMMSDRFEKNKGNTFRYWNKIRMGFGLMFEKNPYNPPFPIETAYNYINAEIYLNYLHLPHSARGDRTTKSRRGSFMIFLLATPSKRFEGYLKIKPFGRVWIKPYFKQEYSIKHISICTEIELNQIGYNKTKAESSKDLYRGFTISCGPEYNLNSKNIYFYLGIKYEGRNH